MGVPESIRGMVSSGAEKGQHFTRLDWAREQFVEKLGIDPFPGTLNLVLEDPCSQVGWMSLRDTPGIRIDNPGDAPGDCQARCYRVRIAGRFDGAIVLPEVERYPQNQIEIIAPVGLRSELGITDGEDIVLEITQAVQQPVTAGVVE